MEAAAATKALTDMLQDPEFANIAKTVAEVAAGTAGGRVEVRLSIEDASLVLRAKAGYEVVMTITKVKEGEGEHSAQSEPEVGRSDDRDEEGNAI